MRHQGQDVIGLGVSMAKGGDIIALGKALREVTEKIQRQLPLGVTLAQVQDQPKAVATSVNEFVRVLIEAVAVVLAGNPAAVADYRSGRQQAIGFLTGQVMRATKGRANPKRVNEVLTSMLEKG